MLFAFLAGILVALVIAAAWNWKSPALAARRWASARRLAVVDDLPPDLANTAVTLFPDNLVASPDLALFRFAANHVPGSRPARKRQVWTVLAIRRSTPGPALRYALRSTQRRTSLIDLYTLGWAKSDPLYSFPSVDVSPSFEPFASQHADPARFASLPQVPSDVSLLLTPAWLFLDLPPRCLTPQRLDELAATRIGF